ncbi:DUF4303 domain-containing protein [Eikenella sp. S3360]|uniref:DUF4303 domain-containing protein n=1 Tax=Eikenella glucosivorans TaxID=2766967 RepID=A0ABS0N7K6_9NEIS|nr:DUF4303 domain-containing protein [Eikenella glucosivorans]MBH5328298.1 DUF4303 domain-containing protein [Eikenella glucosivorans]
MPQPDWPQIENLAYQIIVDAVHDIRRQHPLETVYAAIFHNFYCDNARLYFPSLSVGTEELLARVMEQYQREYSYAESRAELERSLRWSGADLAEYLFDGGTAGNEAAQSVQAAVRREADWDVLYARFCQCFPRACRRATQDLLRQNIVPPGFIAVVCDEDESLTAPCLTPEQLQRHFPELL